jgi:predicted aconitase with swiveling domain
VNIHVETGLLSLCPGEAEGEAFVMAEPLSFWGGLDARTGAIIDRWHKQHGQSLTGRIVFMEAGRGSSSGSSVLAESIRLGAGPAGIVLASRDAIVMTGSLVAAELYGKFCPVAFVEAEKWAQIARPGHYRLAADADGGAKLSRLA